MTAFALGRMRHIDLLALWHEANPGARDRTGYRVARMTKEGLISHILSPG